MQETEKDAIIEYDLDNDKVNPILVDLYASTHKAVLNFAGNIITGINIIDNLLFWTDNNSDPKKINIDDCREGTLDFNTHTQLKFETGSFHGVTLNYTYNSMHDGASVFNGSSFWPPESTPFKKGKYFAYQTNQIQQLFSDPIDWGQYQNQRIRHYRDGELLGEKQVKLWETNNTHGSHGRTEWNAGFDDEYKVGDIIFGDGVNLDIEERHVTVIKPKPLTTFSVKINYSNLKTFDNISVEGTEDTANIPNLFETKFPRFSYRYKYRDGEFSALAPFTNPVFNPKYTKDTNQSNNTDVFLNKDTAYDIKEPYNKAMVNSIHSVELTDFITAQTPEDVVEVDILYKQEDSPVIYSIGTIKHIDPEWHDWSNNQGYTLGMGRAGNKITYAAEGGVTKGKYIVTTENIYAALPANQILRPWDNVPRKALAQEITGNRIVYGNYLQNYNLGVVKPKVKLSYSDRNNLIGGFDTQGLPSIKSQRNYQLGVIYCDKYGRETPVFTSSEGAVNIPWQ